MFVLIDDVRFSFTGNDLAENTRVGHGVSDPGKAGDKVNDECSEHKGNGRNISLNYLH
jgi:hypothetical protein